MTHCRIGEQSMSCAGIRGPKHRARMAAEAPLVRP